MAIVALAAFSVRLDGAIHNLNNKIQLTRNVGIDIEKQRIEKDKQTKIEQDQANQKLQQQIDELNKRVEAKQNSLLAKAIPTAQAAPVPVDNSDAKMFIYMRESGNRTNAVNRGSGACGLGQALPCSKMPCSLSDYACQDNFFTGYMKARYGTWENAKAFWLSHKWW